MLEISQELTDMITPLECGCGKIGSEIVYQHNECPLHEGRVRPDALIERDGKLYYNPQ